MDTQRQRSAMMRSRSAAASPATKPHKPIRITGYRVDTWLNKATNEAMYGVSVKIEGTKGWVRVAQDGAAVIRDTKTSAETYIAGMKRERDLMGFKIVEPSHRTEFPT